MYRLILLFTVLLITVSDSEAQLFKKVVDRAVDKVADRVEDKIVEEVSTELANMAVKPLDNYMDELFRQNYEQEYGKEWDESEFQNDKERQEAMNALWGSMFGTANLPEEYNFAKAAEVEIYNYGDKSPTSMWMIFGSDDKIFAMEQEDKGKKQVIVYDLENDAIAMFDQSNKTVLAMPGVMSMSKGIMPLVEEQMKEEMEQANITRIDGKTFLGCDTKGFKFVDDEEESEFYICSDAGISWSDPFGELIGQLSPTFYQDEVYSDVKGGMLIYANSVRKEDGKVSTWEIKQIVDTDFNIKTSEYQVNSGFTN